MLPAHLEQLKKLLDDKGVFQRTLYEDAMLADLQEVDKATDAAKSKDKRLVEGIEKRAFGAPSVYGPSTDTCPTCGKRW